MDWTHKSAKVLITGKSGSGKTTLWLKLLADYSARFRFCFDPGGEAARRLNWPLCVAENQLVHCAVHGLPICFEPGRMFPGRHAAGFDFFCRWAWNVSQELGGVKVFAVDEVWKFVPARRPVPFSFALLLEEGRKERIDLLLVSRRPNYVHDAIRAELTRTITFQHTDKLPLAWLAEDFDVEAVRKLRVPGEFLTKDF